MEFGNAPMNKREFQTITMHLNSLFKNKGSLERLLYLEKERRGVSKDALVFIGMADVAAYYWCAMKSLYKNREMELTFFSSYLYDRIFYSFQLGLINELPQSLENTLEIGDEIDISAIEQLLSKRNSGENLVTGTLSAIETTDENGDRIIMVSPTLSNEEFDFWEQQAKDRGIRIVSLDEAPPLIRGEIAQNSYAKRYPTIRWNFVWDKYVVVGMPDGITSEFVYEFKSTRNRFLMKFLKPVAFTQADLYGYFFKRSKKLVQIFVIEDGKTETWDTMVDTKRAVDTLIKFKKMELGILPPAPKAWKCKSCEFAAYCALSPL